MAESFVQVNEPTSLGKKLATYEYENTGGDTVESEAVTLTDSLGNEVFPATEPTATAIADSVASIDGKTATISTTAATSPLTLLALALRRRR